MGAANTSVHYKQRSFSKVTSPDFVHCAVLLNGPVRLHLCNQRRHPWQMLFHQSRKLYITFHWQQWLCSFRTL